MVSLPSSEAFIAIGKKWVQHLTAIVLETCLNGFHALTPKIYWRSEIHIVFDVRGIFIFFKPITGNENLKSKFLGLKLLNLNSGPWSHGQKQGGVIVPFFGVAVPRLQPWKSKDSSRPSVFYICSPSWKTFLRILLLNWRFELHSRVSSNF